MKMTIQKMTSLVLLCLLIILTGCEKDLYDPNGGTRTPIITDIPNSFDWSTTSSIDLNVNVDDQFNGNYYYTVEVYDNNPVITTGATLLSKGVAKKGEPFNTSFSVPKTVTSLAIRQIDPRGISIVQVFNILGPVVNCDFTSTKTPAATRSLNRIATKNIVFNNADFPTSIPAGTPTFSKQLVSGSSYTIPDGFYDAVDLEGFSNITLYATGNVHITKLYLTPGSKLYILPNTTLATDTNILGQADAIISINSGATFNTTTLAPSSNIKILNKGIINADVIRMTNSTILYTTGTIKTKGKFSGENGDTQIINEGNITAYDYELAGNSKMDNYGNVTIANKSYISSTGAVWRHLAGTFTTTNMDIEGSNPNSFNACQLIITNLFRLYSATLKIDAGAYTTCKEFYMDNARLEIGTKGLFNVSGTASYNYNTGSNGIYGTGTDYALYKVSKTIPINPGQIDVMYYGGKVQIECPNHLTKKIDDWNSRFKEESTIQWVKAGETSISIEKTDCNPGNNATNGTDPTDPTFPIEVPTGSNYTYAMEDSWPDYGDYDMNDIVVNTSYSYKINSSNKITSMTISGKLRSVGAFKTIGAAIQLDKVISSKVKSVKYGINQLDGSIFQLGSSNIENGQTQAVIPLFDNAHKYISNGEFISGRLINTLEGSTKYPEKAITATITFVTGAVNASDINVKNINFFIVTDKKNSNRTEIHLAGYKATDKVNKSLFGTGVDKSTDQVSYRSKDNLTWGLIIPTAFSYPAEFKSVRDAYTKFESWAQSGGKNEVLWYNTKKDELIYK